MQEQASLRPASLAFQDHAVDLAPAFESKSAAVGQRALPERLVMASGVEHIRGEKQLDLMVAVRHVLKPVAYRLKLDVGGLAQLRTELAHGGLDVVGKRLDGVPGNVRRGDPASLDGLLVEVGGVIGPHIALVLERESERLRATRHTGLLLPVVGNLAVYADVQVAYPESGLARFHPRFPLERTRHPGV